MNTLQQLHFSSCNHLFSFLYLRDTNTTVFQGPSTNLAACVILLTENVDCPDNSPPLPTFTETHQIWGKHGPWGALHLLGERKRVPACSPGCGAMPAGPSAPVPGLISNVLLWPSLTNPGHGLCHGFQS